MIKLLNKQSLCENIKELWPAIVILLTTLIISTLVTEFAFNSGATALGKTFFRFLRLSFLLTLPIFLLPGICSVVEGVFNRGKRYLIQVQEEHDTGVHPLKNWVVRPFQGIGFSMLLAAKLLAFLEIYTGSKITLDTVLPPGKFDVGRFVGSITIGIVVSLLLSFFWSLDDLGIRHYNGKTREVRMIGRYVGLLLPIFFGFYGIIGLFGNNSLILAAKYVAQMVVILYPPFVVFSVLHSRYLKRREETLLKRLQAVSGGILTQDKNLASSAA
jgi:hypothetical protein